MYKQIIIARKDLNMSAGKLAAQVSHGSMAFLARMVQRSVQKVSVHEVYRAYDSSGEEQHYRRADLDNWAREARERGERFFYAKPVNPFDQYGKLELCEPEYIYRSHLTLPTDLYEQWFEGAFTKCVLEAKNRDHLLKAKALAESMGMREGTDFFLIHDACRTELEPEEIDANGVGRTLTVIGFAPMDSEVIDKIGKKYQLYK